MSVEMQGKVPASEAMTGVTRALSYFVVRSSKDTSVLDPQTLQSVYSTKAESVQSSITDDFLLVQDAVGKAKIVDLKATEGDQSVEIAAAGEAGGCSPLVRHASTQGTITTVKMAQSCQSNVQIITYDDGTTAGALPSYEMEMETQSLSLPSNGQVAGLWWNELTPGQYLVQMQDLSLHFLIAPSQDSDRGSQLYWTREEGLSDLKQVEILE